MQLTLSQQQYYRQMLYRNRLFPIIRDNRFIGFITFFICSYIEQLNQDPWAVFEDEPYNGQICWIRQLITDKNKINPKLSYLIWNDFKNYIKQNFNQVKLIRWERYNLDKRKIYYKKLEENNVLYNKDTSRL